LGQLLTVVVVLGMSMPFALGIQLPLSTTADFVVFGNLWSDMTGKVAITGVSLPRRRILLSLGILLVGDPLVSVGGCTGR